METVLAFSSSEVHREDFAIENGEAALRKEGDEHTAAAQCEGCESRNRTPQRSVENNTKPEDVYSSAAIHVKLFDAWRR